MSATEQPIRGMRALTIDTPASPGRVFVANCTVAGDVRVILRDGSAHVITLATGYATFPYSVQQFTTTGTTATATYANGV